jgi:hypothetical protein
MDSSSAVAGFPIFASPKSKTFTRPPVVTKTFAGLTSRWMMFFAWAAAKASAISLEISKIRSTSSGFPRIKYFSVAPSKYSITMKTLSFSLPTS